MEVIDTPETKTVETLIREIGHDYGVDASLALKIARCESGLKQYNKEGKVLRGRVNPDDVGVFQINERYHLPASEKLGLNIYTVDGNIKYAMSLMDHDGIRHWISSHPCWG